MFINWWVDEDIVVYLYNGNRSTYQVSSAIKRKELLNTKWHGWLQYLCSVKLYITEWKNPNKKQSAYYNVYTVLFHLYKILENASACVTTESSSVVTHRWRQWGRIGGRDYQGAQKKFWMWWAYSFSWLLWWFH